MLGIDGITTNQFRRDLRDRDMRLEIVRTSLLRKACAGGPLEPLANELNGPVALVTGGESAVDVAKLLQTWVPKFPKNTFRLRGALLEGEYLDEERAKGLAQMPSKAELQARIVAIVLSPGGNVVGAALAGGRNIAGCVKAMIEKLEKGEQITKQSA